MTHPSRFELDRLVAGELESSRVAELKNHCVECEDCNRYLSSLEQDRDALMGRLNPGEFAARIEERFDKSRPWWSRISTFRPALVPSLVTAATVALLAISLALWFSNPEPPAVRWMGATATATVYVQHETDVSILQGQRVDAGDKVMFEVTLPPPKKGFVALIASEKGGIVTPVLPSLADDAAYEMTGTFRLPGAISSIAGDQPTRLLLVTRDAPFVIRDLLVEVRDLEVGKEIEGLVREVEIGAEP